MLGWKDYLQSALLDVGVLSILLQWRFRCRKHCCYEGYLRANEVDILLPYSGESQMVATGQWDILSGPLTLKGNRYFVLIFLGQQ